MSNPGENVWKVTNPRLRVVKRNPLRAGPEEPIVIKSQSRDPNGPQQATKLAPATASTFASVAAAAGLKPTTGEKPTTATKKVLPKPVNFEPPGSQGEPKNPWTLVNKCHSKSGQNFSPDDGSQEKPLDSGVCGKPKTAQELTPEELERLREARRARRRREKDNKKLLKEEKKRRELYAPKTSKIHVVESNSVQQLLTSSKTAKAQAKSKPTETGRPSFMRSLSNNTESGKPKITFLDEEYPVLGGGEAAKDDLGRKINKKQQPKSVCDGNSETEGEASASEWETEHEDEGTEELGDEAAATCDMLIAYIQQAEAGDGNSVRRKCRSNALPRQPEVAFKSILKRESGTKIISESTESTKPQVTKVEPPKSKTDSVIETQKPITWSELLRSGGKGQGSSTRAVSIPSKANQSSSKPAVLQQSQKPTVVSKKVKRKDPIVFDISDALKSKSAAAQDKKSEAKKKAESSAAPARNVLDSVPVKLRRGKERLTPKKKRPTTMRKIILADRVLRQQLHSALLKKHQEQKMLKKGASAANQSAEKCDKVSKSTEDHSASQQIPLDITKSEPLNHDDAKSAKAKTEKEGPLNESETANAVVTETYLLENQQVSESEKSDRKNPDNTEASDLEMSLLDRARSNLHSRKFGKYCNHSLSKEMDKLATDLLAELVKLQDKKHAEDPEKAKAKRRYVLGLREASKFLKVNKTSALIFAADIEPVNTSGGLTDLIKEMIQASIYIDEDGVLIRNVPIFFVLNRYKLGKACRRKVPVSCAAVLNYQGANETFKAMTELLPKLKSEYQERLDAELAKLRSAETSSAPKTTINPPSSSHQKVVAAEQSDPADNILAFDNYNQRTCEEDVAKTIANAMLMKMKM